MRTADWKKVAALTAKMWQRFGAGILKGKICVKVLFQ